MAGREYPHDIVAERSLLGAMLISKDKCIDILNKASEDDFYEDRHRLIFSAMASLNDTGMAIDVTTVTSYLLDHGQLEKSGGVDYLLQLSESVPTVAHSNHYLKMLHNKATLRRIIRETTRIAEEAYDDVEDIDDFIDNTEKTILKVTQERSAGEFRDIRGVIKSVTDRLNLLQKIDGNISGVKSGFRDLDKITSGFQKGDLIILAARPAMGKTAFALNIAHNAAFKSEEPVAIFSLEMPAEQLVQRIICSMGGIEGSSIRTGEILKTNANKYYAAAERVSKCNMYIDDSPGIRINDIVAKSRKLKSEHGLKLIVIDYLQLITSSSKNRENRQQEVSEISRTLKALARELEVPVISLSQLSRSVEQRPNKRPMMSDLRESGAIEQDADIVSFIYREDYYKDPSEQTENSGLTEIIIAKHRNGATGEVNLAFEKNYSRFSDLAHVGPEGSGEGVRDLRG
ncbi:replicative DNA helicase [Thomasclavelia sp.]|uniref:replicative DNA helicase n=1 Tax=Thomasclavelia sp. TaxID=3025757 RepID=UPI0025DCE99A|nr:replicative DNA helicase [Thomasclavelia sp.]